MIRVVGIGSPFGEDQLGWRTAELLKNTPRLQIHLKDSLDIQISDRPGLTLLLAMKDVKTLYLIDALKAEDEQIGQICKIDKQALAAQQRFFSTHGFGVAAALELANALNETPPKTIIYAIKIGTIDYQAALSPFIAKVCQDLAKQMTEEILAEIGVTNA